MEAGIDSQASREISTFCRSFWSASFSNSADSPPQKMSTSGLPFHSTMRPYAIGVPAGIAFTFTATFHFSFAYSANAFSAASWMNFDTGVMRCSSLSIGAGVWARTPLAAAIATRRARADNIIRRIMVTLLSSRSRRAPLRVHRSHWWRQHVLPSRMHDPLAPQLEQDFRCVRHVLGVPKDCVAHRRSLDQTGFA